MENGVGEGIGGLLGHVVPGMHHANVEQCREMLLVSGARRHDGHEAVALGIDDDGWLRNQRLFGDRVFQPLAGRITGHQSVAVPVRVHHDVDEVGVVERGCGGRELVVGEGPVGRPFLANEDRSR